MLWLWISVARKIYANLFLLMCIHGYIQVPYVDPKCILDRKVHINDSQCLEFLKLHIQLCEVTIINVKMVYAFLSHTLTGCCFVCGPNKCCKTFLPSLSLYAYPYPQCSVSI